MELSRGVIHNGHVVWGVLAICIHSPSIAFSELLLLTPRVPLCQLIEAALALSVGGVRRAMLGVPKIQMLVPKVLG